MLCCDIAATGGARSGGCAAAAGACSGAGRPGWLSEMLLLGMLCRLALSDQGS